MSALTIEPKNLTAAYVKADQNGKNMLKEMFPKHDFNVKITDRVRSFEDACTFLGVDPDSVGNPDEIKDGDARSVAAYERLIIVARALNEGWVPNWNNSSEYKYYPYFDMRSGGFSVVDCTRWASYSFVGSRLCFKSSELALYAGKQFNDLYQHFMTL